MTTQRDLTVEELAEALEEWGAQEDRALTTFGTNLLEQAANALRRGLASGWRSDMESLLVELFEPTDDMLLAANASTASWLEVKGSQLTVNKAKHKARWQAMLHKFAAARGIEIQPTPPHEAPEQREEVMPNETLGNRNQPSQPKHVAQPGGHDTPLPAPAPGEGDDLSWIRGEIIALCEATEESQSKVVSTGYPDQTGAYARGRIHEAKGIRRALCQIIEERGFARDLRASGGIFPEAPPSPDHADVGGLVGRLNLSSNSLCGEAADALEGMQRGYKTYELEFQAESNRRWRLEQDLLQAQARIKELQMLTEHNKRLADQYWRHGRECEKLITKAQARIAELEGALEKIAMHDRMLGELQEPHAAQIARAALRNGEK